MCLVLHYSVLSLNGIFLLWFKINWHSKHASELHTTTTKGRQNNSFFKIIMNARAFGSKIIHIYMYFNFYFVCSGLPSAPQTLLAPRPLTLAKNIVSKVMALTDLIFSNLFAHLTCCLVFVTFKAFCFAITMHNK